MKSRIVPVSSLVVAALLASSSALAESTAHPVELIAGSCAEPAAAVADLATVAPDGAFTRLPNEMAAVVEALGASVMRGEAAIAVPLADLVSSEHAVRVLDAAGTEVIACGEFDGLDAAVSDLHIGLSGEGMTGVVWLHDEGNGTVEASIAVAPLAAPAAPAVQAPEVEVTISKSLYQPSPLEIEAGTTVTWVNEDALPHTSTATTTESHFDSGYLALDDRFSHTFDEPGEYTYFCVYHPRMRGLVIVS